MRIVMLTNTFLPHVGGVSRSVQSVSEELRSRGHQVLVIAPEFRNQPAHETDVIRVPAIQNFNGSDFSVALPRFGFLREQLDRFQPQIIHSHHPYLLGTTALRIARSGELPIVFTHHTLYEHYTHYVPGDSPRLKAFVIELVTRFANLTDQVIAPSESIHELLLQRRVTSPIEVIPTGVDLREFPQADGSVVRTALDIPLDALVVGHLGRLAPEKNLGFLARVIATFLQHNTTAHFLLVGSGPSLTEIEGILQNAGVATRCHHLGKLGNRQEVANAYAAMDVFAFASHSETQGMVLNEAMAAGVPVIAQSAPGVREVVVDGHNGFLLQATNLEAMVTALDHFAALDKPARRRLREGALHTAREFSLQHSGDKLLALYARHIDRIPVFHHADYREWRRLMRLIKAEWTILEGIAAAANATLKGHGGQKHAGTH